MVRQDTWELTQNPVGREIHFCAKNEASKRNEDKATPKKLCSLLPFFDCIHFSDSFIINCEKVRDYTSIPLSHTQHTTNTYKQPSPINFMPTIRFHFAPAEYKHEEQKLSVFYFLEEQCSSLCFFFVLCNNIKKGK